MWQQMERKGCPGSNMAREGSSEEEVFYLEPKDQKALSPLSCW